MHGEEQPPHSASEIFKAVLAHYKGTVFQLRRQMQAFAHNGQYHAARLQQAAEKGHDRAKHPLVVQVAPGQNQIAQAGAEGVKIFGHALQKKIEMQAQGICKQRRHCRPSGMRLVAHGAQLLAQFVRIVAFRRLFRQPAGAEFHYRGGHNRAVGQSQQTVADVAHGRHGEAAAQGRRTAAGIKGRDEMNGIVGVVDQFTAQIAQSRAARKKNQSGAKRRKAEQRSTFAHTALPAARASLSGATSQALRQEGMSPISHMRKKISRPIQASVAA